MSEWVDLRKALIGIRGSRIHVTGIPLDVIATQLASLGFSVHVLPGRAVADEETLFAGLAKALAFPPYFGGNWDALRDSLAEFLECAGTRVALLWTDADALLLRDTQTFVDAVNVLDEAALDAGSVDGSRVQFEVFLLGGHPAFTDQL